MTQLIRCFGGWHPINGCAESNQQFRIGSGYAGSGHLQLQWALDTHERYL